MKLLSQCNNPILCSLMIHSALLLIIIFHVNNGVSKKHNLFKEDINKQKVIVTKLVVAVPKLITPVKNKVKQLEKQSKISKTPMSSQENNSVSKELITDVSEVKNEVVHSSLKNDLEDKTDKKYNESVVQIEEAVIENTEPSFRGEKLKVPVPTNVKSFSRSYLNKQIIKPPNYQDDNRYAGMSEMTNKPPVHNYKYIEEKSIKEKLVINVSCDSIATKTVKTISILLGGRIECESEPDLSQFIKQKSKHKFKYKLAPNNK